jgi:hypothetical protein
MVLAGGIDLSGNAEGSGAGRHGRRRHGECRNHRHRRFSDHYSSDHDSSIPQVTDAPSYQTGGAPRKAVGRAIRAFAGYRKTTTRQTSLLFLYAKAIKSLPALAT